MRRGLFAALLTLALASTAQAAWWDSYRPAPSSRNSESRPPQTYAGDYQTAASSKHPSAVAVAQNPSAPSQQKDDKATPAPNEQDNKTAADWWLVFWTAMLVTVTGLLVIVTTLQVGLFFWQLTLIRGSLSDAKVAADAAKKTADAAILQAKLIMASERARIIQSTPQMQSFFPKGKDQLYDMSIAEHRPIIAMKFGNIGRTAGFFRETRGQIEIGDAPKTPTFTYPPTIAGEQVVRADTQTDAIEFRLDRALSRDEIKRIQKGELNVWFFGYGKYTDAFFVSHERWFAFHILRGNGPETPWVPVVWGGNTFNYEKSSPES